MSKKDEQEIGDEDVAKVTSAFPGSEVQDGFGPRTAEEAAEYAVAAAASDAEMDRRAAKRTAGAARTEVEPVRPRYTDEQLHALQTPDDVRALFAGSEIAPFDIEELGSGFELIEDDKGKRQLVGVPFFVIEFMFNVGDIWVPNDDADKDLPPGVPGQGFYRRFVTMYVMCNDGRKYIVNDGGTGIYDQMIKLAKRYDKMGKPYRGVVCRKGLRVSDYDYVDPITRVKTPAATFYLDTSAKTTATKP